MAKRLTTKQLKNRMDGLTFALALCSMADKVGSEKWNELCEKHDTAIAEFYARRNHKQYLDKGDKE